MPPFRDLSGQRFGRLIAVRTDGIDHRGQHRWLCRCDCGKEKTVPVTYLTAGWTRSCGCLRTETAIKHNKSAEKRASTAKWNQTYKRKHGQTGTRLYKVWQGMKRRCLDPKSHAYKDYGGRGIRLCEEWVDDFEAFRAWALANGYSDRLTIERKDNDGDYTPENCKWADIIEQANNKRSNVLLTVDGRTQTLKQWADELGLNYYTLYSRYDRGWPADRILKEAIHANGGRKHEKSG